MTGVCHVTDLVHGVPIDQTTVTLEPILAGFLRLPLPAGTQTGDEVYVVVKATVQAVLPT